MKRQPIERETEEQNTEATKRTQREAHKSKPINKYIKRCILIVANYQN